ncbi:MAG TPA: hypothetical protein VIK31_03170 [Propionibacteriaceae bacterium]
MTIQQWQPPQAAVPTIPSSVVRLVDAFQESEAAFALAERLVQTSFCPTAFRGRPGEAAAAMMAGSEIGLSPLAALGAFDVIEGRAAARAITLRAVVQARGHEIVLVESSDTKCKMKGRRAGSEEWQTVLWTIDRAKLANLVNNPKKPQWTNWPAAMLVARCTSELARLIAADALLGLAGGYSSEEIADGFDDSSTVQVVQAPQEPRRTLAYSRPAQAPVDAQEVVQDAEVIDAETGEVTEPAPAQRRTLTRRRPTQEPDPVEEKQTEIRDLKAELQEIRDEAAPDASEPVHDGSKLTTTQRGKILAMFTGLEITDRDERLQYMTKIVGHEVDSTNHLSKWDAHVIIEHLELIGDPIDARNQINDDDAIEVAEEPGPVSPDQLARLGALMTAAGLTKAEMLAEARRIAGHDLTHSTDMTAPEADRLAEYLAGVIEPETD